MVIFSIIFFSCEKQPTSLQPYLKFPLKKGTFWQYMVHDTTSTHSPTDTTIITEDTLLLDVIGENDLEIVTPNNTFRISYQGETDTFHVFYYPDSVRTDYIPILEIPNLIFPRILEPDESWGNGGCERYQTSSPEEFTLPDGTVLKDVVPVKRMNFCQVENNWIQTYYTHPTIGLVSLKSSFFSYFSRIYLRKYSLQLIHHHIAH